MYVYKLQYIKYDLKRFCFRRDIGNDLSSKTIFGEIGKSKKIKILFLKHFNMKCCTIYSFYLGAC